MTKREFLQSIAFYGLSEEEQEAMWKMYCKNIEDMFETQVLKVKKENK